MFKSYRKGIDVIPANRSHRPMVGWNPFSSGGTASSSLNQTDQAIKELGTDIRAMTVKKREELNRRYNDYVAEHGAQEAIKNDIAVKFAKELDPDDRFANFVRQWTDFESEWTDWWNENASPGITTTFNTTALSNHARDVMKKVIDYRQLFIDLGGTVSSPTPKLPAKDSLFGDWTMPTWGKYALAVGVVGLLAWLIGKAIGAWRKPNSGGQSNG